jgi:hypothetical protein
VPREHLHMYVPERLMPVYVALIGRRRCCGVRRAATHLRGCPGRAAGPVPQAVTMPRALLHRLP